MKIPDTFSRYPEDQQLSAEKLQLEEDYLLGIRQALLIHYGLTRHN